MIRFNILSYGFYFVKAKQRENARRLKFEKHIKIFRFWYRKIGKCVTIIISEMAVSLMNTKKCVKPSV